mgnify:CR=1 FL=1
MKVRLEITRVGLIKMKSNVVFSVFKGKKNRVYLRQTLLFSDLIRYFFKKPNRDKIPIGCEHHEKNL